MCGFVGIIGPKGSRIDISAARCATRAIRHRGPDSAGEWIREAGDVFLGFQRLAIIDVGKSSDQPMLGDSGAVLVFNGEIYNYHDLRNRLRAENANFRSQGDTEVLLHWLTRRGFEHLTELEGMFAFVFWDETRRRATAVRDFFGIKPLYYWCPPRGGIVFASEIKSLLALPEFNPRLAEKLLPEYLRFRSLSGPETLLADVQQVMPGQLVSYDQTSGVLTKQYYWSPLAEFHQARSLPCPTEDELLQFLKGDVRKHLIADVPVGTQFSGGIDSGLVCAIAVSEVGQNMRGFHCHVRDTSYDETPFARDAAKHLGIIQEETAIGATHLLSRELETLTWHMDEPLGHPNAVGVYAVSSLAREKVKVLLSGEGADEIFAGYYRYSHLLLAEQLRDKVPNIFGILPDRLLPPSRLRRFVQFAKSRHAMSTDEDILQGTQFVDSGDVASILGIDSSPSVPESRQSILSQLRGLDVLSACQIYDVLTYLPPLLIRQDKMSMAASIENRVPFVTPAVFRMAMRYPPGQRASSFRRKIPLTHLALRYLPQATVTRPKMGFGVPLGDYFQTEMGRDRLYGLALDGVLNNYCDKRSIQRLVGTFDGTQSAAEPLWNLVTLAAWVDVFIRRNHPPLT